MCKPIDEPSLLLYQNPPELNMEAIASIWQQLELAREQAVHVEQVAHQELEIDTPSRGIFDTIIIWIDRGYEFITGRSLLRPDLDTIQAMVNRAFDDVMRRQRLSHED